MRCLLCRVFTPVPLIALCCVVMLSAAATATPIKLNYSMFFPATHAQAKAGMDWAREIEARSGGRVKITVFPGGILGKAHQIFDYTAKGISDIGMSCFAYTRGRFPVMEVLDLPIGYPDGLTATRAANQFYTAVTPAELKAVKVLYLHAHGPGRLHTRTPVVTLSDLHKMKIRSTGLSAKIVDALGGVPVAMAQGATYESLQKGVVEGTFGPFEVLKGWRQAEVIQSSTDCHQIGYTTAMFVVMNNRKWHALPADLKIIFDQTSAEWIDVHGKTWDDADAAGRAYTRERGNAVHELSDAEAEKWVNAVQPIMEDYKQRTAKRRLPGAAYVSQLRKIIQLAAAR
ncbi:MAG: C4-dicarboxylate ABC transporter substrate-binding protein [Deltaproteobacteria bacterium]|nr:MAG: C4-dicarboxylate ABC transporter substrate-binding protein [Deltaproteobacteria bacterium]